MVHRGGRHVVVAGEQPEAAVELGVDEGLRLPDGPEDALGVVHEAWVVVVEAHGSAARLL